MSNRANSRSFSELDKMSTGELEAVLRMDAQLPEGEGCDTDLILYITDIIAKRERENPAYSLPDVDKAWNTFNEKYRPHTDGGLSLYEDGQSDITELSGIKNRPSAPDNTSPVRRKGRGLARAALIAAVIAVLMLAATVTSYALGYDLWGHVAGWSRESFGFVPDGQIIPSISPSQSSQKELSELQAVLDAHGITANLIPKYIPEGFKHTDIYVDDVGIPNSFTSCLEKSEQTIVVEVITNANIVLSDYEKDEGDPEIYETNGVEHYIMTNMGKYLAVWRTENYEVSISGLETRDELIKMIDSIYEEK